MHESISDLLTDSVGVEFGTWLGVQLERKRVMVDVRPYGCSIEFDLPHGAVSFSTNRSGHDALVRLIQDAEQSFLSKSFFPGLA